ncbi:hypothetical protein SALBM311S_04559 [Streptomyces alboniger]
MTATTTESSTGTRAWTGRSMPRKEDDRLLRAEGEFGDDTPIHRLGYVFFVRSPYAHARITGIDVSAAEIVPGYLGCLLPEEAEALTEPFIEIEGPGPTEGTAAGRRISAALFEEFGYDAARPAHRRQLLRLPRGHRVRHCPACATTTW